MSGDTNTHQTQHQGFGYFPGQDVQFLTGKGNDDKATGQIRTVQRECAITREIDGVKTVIGTCDLALIESTSADPGLFVRAISPDGQFVIPPF